MLRAHHSASLTIVAAVVVSITGAEFASADTKTGACPYVWTQNLKIGTIGDDVLKLQQYLNSFPDTQITQTGAGSPGKETRKYGARTAKAITKFQEKYKDDILSPAGLTKGTGIVLGQTRAKLNALCVATSAPVINIKGGSVSSAPVAEIVEVDALTVTKPEQPQTTTAPANAWSVPFTNITLTAGSKDVTVNDLTIERTGPAADGAFYSISLYDEEGNAIGGYKGLHTNHRVELGDPFVIPAHSSTTISVMGNMNADLTEYAGQAPALQIVAINASSPITGTLPIKGTAQAINNSLVIGSSSAMLSQFDPSTATNRYINDKGVRFSGIRITAHTEEALRFGSIAWDQVGTAGESDIENVVTVVNGVSYPTKVKGKLYESIFDPQILVGKGQSIDVYVQGDLKTSGSNRTVKFDIRKSDNIWLIGDSYGFDVGIVAEANTDVAGNSIFTTSDGTVDGTEVAPFFSGSVATINGGAFVSVGR